MGARILVVEDTPHNLQLMTYLLEAHGHTVIAAVTGERGIELARHVAAGSRRDGPATARHRRIPGVDGASGRYPTSPPSRSSR